MPLKPLQNYFGFRSEGSIWSVGRDTDRDQRRLHVAHERPILTRVSRASPTLGYVRIAQSQVVRPR
jgi:hypothetical protein